MNGIISALESTLSPTPLNLGVEERIAEVEASSGRRIVGAVRVEIMDDVTCPYCEAIQGMFRPIEELDEIEMEMEVHENCRGDWAFVYEEVGIPYQRPPAEIVNKWFYKTDIDSAAARNIPKLPIYKGAVDDAVIRLEAGYSVGEVEDMLAADWVDADVRYIIRKAKEQVSPNAEELRKYLDKLGD